MTVSPIVSSAGPLCQLQPNIAILKELFPPQHHRPRPSELAIRIEIAPSTCVRPNCKSRSFVRLQKIAQTRVARPWIEGNTLMRRRVLVPQKGLGSRIVGTPEVIALNIEGSADRFLSADDCRIRSFWVVGETGA